MDEEDFEENPDSLVVVGDDQQDQAISQSDPNTISGDSLLSEIDNSSDSEALLELEHLWSGDGTGTVCNTHAPWS